MEQNGDCAVKDFGFEVSPHAEQINAPGPELCNTNIMRVPFYDYTFEIKQFHIHVSSEHTLNSKHFGAELHVVHKAREADDVFAVLGFFIEPTATVSHPIFDQILRELDEEADEVANKCNMPHLPHWWQSLHPGMKSDIHRHNQTLNVYDLIPEGASFYNYDGGLTTPPCTEAVVWNLVDRPIQITPAQYTDLVALIVNHIDEHFSTIADPLSGSTSRPTQPLNGRRLERFCPEIVVLQAEEAEDVVVEAAEEEIEVEENGGEETKADDKKKDKGVEVSKRENTGGRLLYQFRGGRRW
jgi:carbonic anhydrase